MAEQLVTLSVGEVQQIIDSRVKAAVEFLTSQGEPFAHLDWTMLGSEVKEDTGCVEGQSSSVAARSTNNSEQPRRTNVTELTKLLADLDIAKFQSGLKMKSEKEGHTEFEPVFQKEQCKTEIKLPKTVRDLSHWGQAVVTFGKHKDRQYQKVFDMDPGYARWLIGQGDRLTSPAARDFLSYCLLQSQAGDQAL